MGNGFGFEKINTFHAKWYVLNFHLMDYLTVMWFVVGCSFPICMESNLYGRD